MDYPKSQFNAAAMLGVVKALVLAARPRQWTKNLIIYVGLFFTVNEAWQPGDLGAMFVLVGKTTLAFALFSALTGAIYIINDIFDIEKDRLHPKKRFRPIPSGQVPLRLAWGTAIALLVVGIAGSIALEPLFAVVSMAYVIVMIAYTLSLKRVVLLDVFAISGGFVLRAIAGVTVLQVPISPWLYICTGLGALCLALTKRRTELVAAGEQAVSQRDTLDRYTAGLLDQLISIVATSVVLTYTLYTFTAPNLPENHSMMLTIPLVIYGLFRYLFLVYTRNVGESPEETLITDGPLIVTIALWLASAALILGVFR